MGFLWTILVNIVLGALYGWIAGKIMKSNGSLIRNIILGIVGSFVGGIIAAVLGAIGLSIGGWIGSLLFGVAGACLCIWLARKFLK